MRLIVLFVAMFILALSFPAQAQEVGAIDLSRLSIATGLDYSWSSITGDNAALVLPDFQRKELEVPVNLAYSLLASPAGKPLLSLVAGSSWGLESHIVKTRVGVRLMLYTGGK